MGKLTDTQLRAWIKTGAPIPGRSDGGGLTFTLSKNGVASWVLRYRIARRQREVTLGRYPDISLAKARTLSAENRVAIQQVIDVAAVKQERKREAKLAGSVAELSELWLDHAIRPKHKHPEVTERVVRKDILPSLGKRIPRDVTTADITRLLAKITQSGRPTVSNDALRHLKSMFDYGLMLGMVSINPADKLKIHHAGGKEEARKRKLTQTEIRKLFKAIKNAGSSFGRENEIATKLLLITGCRKMELLAAEWSEIDLSTGSWQIPGSRTKTKEPRELTLPPLAINWLNELNMLACGSNHVFPARRICKKQRNSHVSPDTINAALKRLKHGLEPFTVHDFRRTSRSLMSEIGVAYDVAEKTIGHKLPRLAAIYDKGDAKEQIKITLIRLATLIESLESDEPAGNVLTFSRGAFPL